MPLILAKPTNEERETAYELGGIAKQAAISVIHTCFDHALQFLHADRYGKFMYGEELLPCDLLQTIKPQRRNGTVGDAVVGQCIPVGVAAIDNYAMFLE